MGRLPSFCKEPRKARQEEYSFMTDLPTPEQPDVGLNPKPSLTDHLPDYVKDPKNYMKIEKALLETLSCGKLHSDPLQMTECLTCTENMKLRRELMKKFGFYTPAIYQAWRKIHQEIKKRVPLDKYNHLVNEK